VSVVVRAERFRLTLRFFDDVSTAAWFTFSIPTWIIFSTTRRNVKFSHRRTCVYATCYVVSYVWSRLTCFHANLSTTRRLHVRVRKIKDGYLHTFWLTKTCLRVKFNTSHHFLHLTSYCYTWNEVKPHNFNLQTILRMQLLKYETTSENISLTDAKTMMRVHCKNVPICNFSTYMSVYVCKFTHRKTYLYTTCNRSQQMCQQRDVFMHTFWLMKTRLCVIFNT